MKIIIVSDTHGSETNLEYVIEKEKPFDRLIHLGDLEGAEEYIEILADCPVDLVRGNCDFLSDLPGEDMIELGAYKAFITHGHYHTVSMGEEALKEEALANGADFAMYGHTHVPSITEYEGITIMNPGSLTFPRQSNRRPSYIVMEIEGKQIDAEIMFL